MSGQEICKNLLCIYRDMAFYFTKTKLKDPCFSFTYAKGELRNKWVHSWSNNRILRVRVLSNSLDREKLLWNMIHILIHAYNGEYEISDMSDSLYGRYHKRSFKNSAHKFGIPTEYDKNYGYQISEIPEEIFEDCMRIIDGYYAEIQVYLNVYIKYVAPAPSTRNRAYVTYQCPVCKRKVKAMDNAYLICGIDKCLFERV